MDMIKIHKLAESVRLLIMDVDGVLTDGRIFITGQGEEIKAFNSLDGQGLKMLQESGVKLAIITGRDASCVRLRAQSLSVDYYFAGIQDKLAVFKQLLIDTDLNANDCAYIGDDVVDLPVMSKVALAVSVPQAPTFVRSQAHYVTTARAGCGAVRELCETIMHAQGTFEPLMNRYLK